MSIAEFVSDLKKLGVRLSVNGQRLRVNAPKGVLTSTLRAQIAERKQELLQFLSDHEQSAALIPPSISRRTSSDPAPLSFAQERLWFLEQLEPGSTVYNICRAFRVTGNLNIAALEASLTDIVHRHEILRSQIRVADRRPVQVAAAVPRFEVPVIDLHLLTGPERDREVCDRIKAEAEWQFDFSAGLFFRAVLLQISDHQHILILTTHHIVSDAWSMGILTKEVWTLYDAYANGRPSPLQELPVQYADYAFWQRQWLQVDVLESQLSYWKEQLKELPILNLPTDHSRPAKQSLRGARQPIALPESLTAAVNELSRREGVTQFMTLLAVFYVLLYRYSGQEDVVVGSPIANRNRTETEGLIGFFVNTLVLRTGFSGNPSFREFLLRVRDVCLDAYAHQDLPFEKLVQELQPQRDLRGNPLFQLMFVLQNTPRAFVQPAGLAIERVDAPTTTLPFDLSLYLRERDKKLIGFFDYSTDLFDSSTIERMAGHFQRLLEGIVADPGQPISTLPLLTEAERHRLFVEWNATGADYPRDCCIHELFEAQAEKTPDALAVQFEGKSLTYGELNGRANQVAHYLQGLGVGPENLVGICVERSLEMVVGLLGILKAGGAYVPLDPAYPRERLEFMLNDAQVSVLLSQAKLVKDRGWRMEDRDPRLKVVCLDRDWDKIAQRSVANPKRETKADGAAYVIYTSGSTGTPKGVVGLHRGAVNRFTWMWSAYPFGANEMSCVKTSLSFVDSVWEVLGPLLKGIPSTIIPEQIAQDPQLLIQTLADEQVTRIVLGPSLLRSILDVDPDLQDHVPKLKLWTSSGELLSKELADRFHQCLPNRKLLNLYGSSEVSADVTCYETHKTEPSGSISIGRPIHNTQIYLLDSELQPVPIGVSGEICVGGAGLARGYLNGRQLTTERFVPNTFCDESGTRLYRTGDLARYLSDGNIEFLGRIDNQVKIRGHRIEPAEVEAVLNQHPAVRESVVVAHDGATPAERHLVAYAVLTHQPPPSANQLRSFLKDKLPDYMVPRAFAMLEALPLLPNGKVDRQSLPAPDEARTQITQIIDEPCTEIEELVLQVWKEVLRLEKVGMYDNFFELGGHSLLGVQIVSRLRAIFQREVPVRALFETPTVAGLANAIEKKVRGRDEIDLPPIVPISREGPLPISILQEPFFVLDQLIGGAPFLNMPYAYRLSGQLNALALGKAIQEIVSRHEALRTVFDGDEDAPFQIVRRARTIKLSFVDLARLSPEKKEKKLQRLSKEDASMRFDLTKGPVLRTKLVRLEKNEHVLFVTMHHIVSDQWSMAIFRRELGIIYEAFSKGLPSPLAQPSLQFADFVLWQREMLNRGFFDEQIDYWKRQLSAPLAKLDFQKRQKRRRTRIRFRSSRQPIKIDLDLYRSIKEFALRENYTPFMVFVAALNILLHLYTGEQDIRIGTLIANRGRRGTEDIIGYFVNELILRNFVIGHMTCGEVLDQVRKGCIAAYAYQDLPFDYLESLLSKEDDKDAPALCQVMFNYRNFPMPAQEFAGIAIAPLDAQHRASDPGVMISRVDLMIHLRETSTKLTGAVNYKTDIFSDEGMTRILGAFDHILRFVVCKPHRIVGDCASGVAW